MAHRSLRPCHMEELGPGLDPHRGQPAARREADAPRPVVRQKRCLPKPWGARPRTDHRAEGTGLEARSANMRSSSSRARKPFDR